jgi:hypothetical protein
VIRTVSSGTRNFVKRAVDFLVNRPWIGLVFFLVLSGLVTYYLPATTRNIIKSSLPSAASVAFALFGFGITSVSIIATLKNTPVIQSLQTNASDKFKNLIDYFILTIVTLFLWGLMGLFLPSDFKNSQLHLLNEKIFAGVYIFLTTFSLYISICTVWLLRLLVLA